MRLKRWFEVAALVPWNLLCGLLLLSQRSLPRARRHFQKVLAIRPDHFLAHVGLGRIALLEENEIEGLRELRTARRINPRRFERLHLIEEYERYAAGAEETEPDDLLDDGIGLEYVDGSAPVSPPAFSANNDGDGFDRPRPRRSGPRHSGRAPRPRLDVRSTDPDPARLGDFSSVDELRSFRGLEPIRREDIRRIDWERVDSRLFED